MRRTGNRSFEPDTASAGGLHSEMTCAIESFPGRSGILVLGLFQGYSSPTRRGKMKARFGHLLAAALLAALATGAGAQTVKVGVVLPYSGVGAEFAQQVDRGMQVFLKLNPNAFGGYKIELVKRDSKNPSGAEAKTAVQELITQEKVDILTGFIYSPDAIASAPLVTEGKKPMIIM